MNNTQILSHKNATRQSLVILSSLILLTGNVQKVLAEPHDDLLSQQQVLGKHRFNLDEIYASNHLNRYRVVDWNSVSLDEAESAEGAGSDATKGSDKSGPTIEEINKMLNNPLAYLWMLYVENDTTLYKGGPFQDDQVINTTIIQPVMPIPLTKDLNLINRPIIPLISAELPEYSGSGAFPDDYLSGGSDFTRDAFSTNRSFNLGDIAFMSMLAPREPWKLGEGKFIAGLGPTFMFPTATDKRVGSKKWSAGPAGVAAYLGETWTFGLIAQQYWSFAGDSSRPDVNKSIFQYTAWYSLPDQWQIGTFPIITVNWEAKGNNKLTLPVGLAVSKTLKIGKVPTRVIFGVDYTVVQPEDFHSTWNFRIAVIPIIPNPMGTPLFNNL